MPLFLVACVPRKIPFGGADRSQLIAYIIICPLLGTPNAKYGLLVYLLRPPKLTPAARVIGCVEPQNIPFLWR